LSYNIRTKSTHNAALIDIYGVFWLDPAILLSDIEVPIHSLRREIVESVGFLPSPYLAFQLWAPLNVSGYPVLA